MFYLNNGISPSVVCVINRQNIILKYGMRGHFRYRGGEASMVAERVVELLHDFGIERVEFE